MALTIRALEKRDASSYRTCRLNALKLAPTAFSSSYESASKLPDAFFAERVDLQPHSFVFGAFADETLIATAGGFVNPELKCSHIGNVVGMWVDPAFRGQHLARKLLRAVIEQFRNHNTVTNLQLGVTEGNAAALALYQSEGFVEWGVEPDAISVDGQRHSMIHMSMTL